MDIKITQAQFENSKIIDISSTFEQLDVDKDGSITDKDLSATTNSTIKADIQKLFEQVDEDYDITDDDIDDLNNLNSELKTKSGKISVGDIEGYTEVDVTNLDGKTSEEIEAMIASVVKNITLLNDKIAEIEKENETLNAEVAKLTEENKGYDTEIAKLEADNKELEAQKKTINDNIDKAKAELAEKQEKVKEEEAKLTTFTNEFMLIQEELDRVNQQIIEEQHFEQKQYEEQIEDTTEKAIADYDPAIHGTDFQKYFLKRLSEAGYVMFSGLDSLNNMAASLSSDAKTILGNIHTQAEIVYYARADVKAVEATIASLEKELEPIDGKIAENDAKIADYQKKKDANQATIDANNQKINENNTTIADLQKEIDNNTTKKTTLEAKLEEVKKTENYNAKDILAKISDAEKKLALDNNVDLTKCFIAQAKDGNWHIYLEDGTSLARKYGTKGKGLRGSDIIPSGSGYVKHKKETTCDGKNAKEIYRLSEVNEDLSDGVAETSYATYSTSSPLSFDVDGDGVNTSEKQVMFDIDGNGTLDKVNDSAEWVLAFDKDKDGIAGEDGSELFGDNTDLDGDGVKDGYANGFEALKALAKQEGLIGDNDSVLDEKDLNTLSEKYGLTMTKGYGGESKSLSELGITQINLAQTSDTKLTKNFDGRHNDIMTQEGATFVVNGETREYADIWNAKFNEPNNEFSTNNPEINLHLNEDNILALKGFVDFDNILEDAKNGGITPDKAKNKIEKYEKELEAKEAEKAEEAQKEEEKKNQKA